jgi:CxxC motif-containing protein
MAVEKKVLTCITCPIGCEITAELTDGAITSVTGNSCPRGEKYTREELTAPRRMLTSTVRLEGGRMPLLPVVSEKTLPKGKILACAEALRSVKVEAPIKEGAVVCENILGLGVDIVASRDMERV